MPPPIQLFTRQLNRLTPWRLGQIAIILVFGLIYWLTLDTGLQPYELRGGDLITHQYAQVQARPSNAPGYPLYTMGGWLWFHTQRTVHSLLGDPAALPPNPMPMLSSYSTVWALLALWLMLGIFAQVAGPAQGRDWFRMAVAWLITAFFGLTYFFWYYATTTEQYSSAVAQTLAIVLVYLRWEQDPTRLVRLFLLALLCGLALAHMLTVAFIVPPLVMVVLLRAPWLRRSAKAVTGAVLAALSPLAAYAFVWLRGARNPQWWGQGEWATPQAWFWDFVGTAQGREELLWGFEPGRAFFGNGFPETMWQELSVPLLLLGLIGIAFLPSRLSAILYPTLAIYLAFCWAYRYGNWFQVILPAYPLILLGVAPAIHVISSRVAASSRANTIFRTSIIVALCAVVLWRGVASLPAANSRDRAADSGLDRAAVLITQPLPPSAQLFAAVDDALALDYLINIWGIRPDLTVISSPQADALLHQGETVFATWDVTPTLLDEVSLNPDLAGVSADWIGLNPSPTTAPATSIHIIRPDLTLAAVTVHPAPPSFLAGDASSDALDATLLWSLAGGTWPADLAISLRVRAGGVQLTDPSTGALIQQDRSRPVHGLWPDRTDGAPALVLDTYRLGLPAGTRGHELLLILYTHDDGSFHNVAELTIPLPKDELSQ